MVIGAECGAATGPIPAEARHQEGLRLERPGARPPNGCRLSRCCVPGGTWRRGPMSWSELERLVEDAETQGDLRRALRHCRSRQELILAARRLGCRITRLDLQRAWQEEQAEQAGDLQAQG
jgi:hypothetical protein